MINDFLEEDLAKQHAMDQELELVELENIQSLWYFVRSDSVDWIVGSVS